MDERIFDYFPLSACNLQKFGIDNRHALHCHRLPKYEDGIGCHAPRVSAIPRDGEEEQYTQRRHHAHYRLAFRGLDFSSL